MTKLVYFSADPNDSSSFYRGILPLSKVPGVQIERPTTNVTWSTIAGNDVGFMLRPTSADMVKLAGVIKSQMPLWVDYDDHLFAVPPENPAHAYFIESDTQENIEKICGLADIITVSTPALLDVFSPLASDVENVVVVPNAHNDFLFGTDRNQLPRTNSVFWRGTATHVGDLFDHRDEIAKAAVENPDWDWHFMGAVPWPLIGHVRVAHHKPLDIFKYHEVLHNVLTNAIHMIPLSNNRFNHCKSNIAWIEAIAAGALAIVPDWPEWADRGALTYGPNQSLAEALSKALAMPAKLREELVDASWDYIQKNLLLSDVNNLRAGILEGLVK